MNFDDLYFAASEAGLYLENMQTSEITFAYSVKNNNGNRLNRKEAKQVVFNLCNAFGNIKSIQFNTNHVVVRFE